MYINMQLFKDHNMKEILCFMIVLCIALGSLTAQQNYFIAGDTSGVIYYDIDPDVTILGYEYPNSYLIDIDLDGTNDFVIEAEHIVSQMYYYQHVRVGSYGSNMVGYSHSASWFGSNVNAGIGLGLGDIINEDILYTTGHVYLKRYENGYWGNGSVSWNSGDYIPVCLKIEGSSECIYGWIKVYDVSSVSITLDSYAVNISQLCLPDGITFGTQAQIDSFQINYYGCSAIEGNVNIHGNDITNLDGLSVLTSIGGNVRIGGHSYWHNYRLNDISGLSNLTTIGGGLSICYNDSLTSLAGLENLDSIGGGLGILGNPLLSSLEELSGIDENINILEVSDNAALTNLTGLEGITNIDNNLLIVGNHALTNISGLQNLTTIGGFLRLLSNTSLSSLSGLSNVISIGDYLKITQNHSLNDLTGLGSLTNIDSSLFVTQNNGLISLSGLDSVTSIGGDVLIQGNNTLSSLNGLEAVSSIGGRLWIDNNGALESLSGIDSISAATIEDLSIWDNPLLNQCEVISVCAYLADPGGNLTINNNAIGCNSPEEVLDSCETHFGYYETGIDDITISVFPNPANSEINISAGSYGIEEVVFYTITGQQKLRLTESREAINISTFQPGMYIVEVMVKGRKVRRKLMVQE
jgi:hypothetical protein